MRVPHKKGVANHLDPESCGGRRKATAEALTGVRTGQVSSRERCIVSGADDIVLGGRQHWGDRYRKGVPGRAWSKALCTYQSSPRGSREAPRPATLMVAWSAEGTDG
jgi:hypothetical protein